MFYAEAAKAANHPIRGKPTNQHLISSGQNTKTECDNSNLFALSHPNSGGVSQIMFCICYVMVQERLCKYPALHELEVCQGVDFGFAYKTKDVGKN